MKKLALVVASLAGLGLATPGLASDNSARDGRIQLAQAGVSVTVGTPVRPAVRKKVIVRDSRPYARADRVVIVKKKKPAKRTVIIER